MLADRQQVRMSFLNITDPKKRDAIVKEYLATISRIKHRNLQERAHDFANHEMLEESLEPVIRSSAKSTEAITNELIPIKEGITALNAKLQSPTTAVKTESESESETATKSEEEKEEEEKEEEPKMYQKLLQGQAETSMDEYFGISVNNENEYMMGDKVIELSGNDIIVDDVTYTGTPGLWTLILFKKPMDYSEEDLEDYKKLVKQTNVITNPHNLRENSRPKLTYKWKHIFKEMEKGGHGIDFLPSDITSLQQKLSYLLAEYRAGNTSATRNEIVAIADNLLKRKHITKAEYRKINNYIASR